ncbi:EamA family transporter [Psychrobacter sp. HD31]|uniref:EamA family transporter n=1 Tax=Psychrobacter sp. HD31 TaxID=3112003 RepID=UPI003DA49BD0
MKDASTSVKQLKNILITSITPIIWGTTYIVTTELLPEDRPLIASVIRVLPAGILLTLIGRQLPTSSHGQHILLKILILSALNIALFQACLFIGAYRLPGGIAAVIGSIQPLIIMLLFITIDGKRINLIAMIAMLTSIVGMGMLFITDTSFLASLDMTGVIGSFLGAVSMASGIYLTKKWKSSFQGVNNLTFTGWQLLFGGLMLLPFMIMLEPLPTELTGMNIIGYTYLTIFGALLAYVLWFRGIEKVNPVSVSMLGALSPITATIIGWACLGESLSVLQMLGFMMVMISVIIIQIQGGYKSKCSFKYSNQSN